MSTDRPLTAQAAQRCIEAIGLQNYHWALGGNRNAPVTDDRQARPMRVMITHATYPTPNRRWVVDLTLEEVLAIIAENRREQVSDADMIHYGHGITVSLESVVYDIVAGIIASYAFEQLTAEPSSGGQSHIMFGESVLYADGP